MLIRHDVTNRLRNCNWLFGNPLTTSSARARQLYWSGMLVRDFGTGARRGRSSGLVSWTWHLSRSDDVPTYIVMDRIIEQEYDHAYIDTTWWTVQYEHRRQKDLLMIAYACWGLLNTVWVLEALQCRQGTSSNVSFAIASALHEQDLVTNRVRSSTQRYKSLAVPTTTYGLAEVPFQIWIFGSRTSWIPRRFFNKLPESAY